MLVPNRSLRSAIASWSSGITASCVWESEQVQESLPDQTAVSLLLADELRCEVPQSDIYNALDQDGFFVADLPLNGGFGLSFELLQTVFEEAKKETDSGKELQPIFDWISIEGEAGWKDKNRKQIHLAVGSISDKDVNPDTGARVLRSDAVQQLDKAMVQVAAHQLKNNVVCLFECIF